jgi:hypothetical protein
LLRSSSWRLEISEWSLKKCVMRIRIAPEHEVPNSRATALHRAQVSSSILTERPLNRFAIKFLLYKNVEKLKSIYTFDSPILHRTGAFTKIFCRRKIVAKFYKYFALAVWMLAVLNSHMEYMRDEWLTPPPIIEMVRLVFDGVIGCDPATCPKAQAYIKALVFHTKADNGLFKYWCGTTWLNGPYSLIDIFIGKFLMEWNAGRVTAGIVLTNNNTDADWWQRAAAACQAICFTRGRINFNRADGRPNDNGPEKGQTLFYFGQDVEKFRAVFGKIGLVR